jgi:thiamine-phosphate pyrophosphorylase
MQPLYAIIDIEVAERAGWRPTDLARAFLAGGARFLQLRAKTLGGADFLETAFAIATLAHEAGAILIVNDRADIARLAGADGVHIGQDDLTPALARRVVGGATVGFSTHTPAQIDAALDLPIDYLAVGPVFATATKATGYDAVGLSLVAYAAERAALRGLPVVAIGGMTLERAPEVVAAGAASVAVIADLLAGGDPAARVAAYLRHIAAVDGARRPDRRNI